jgi:hypothetical protein
MNPNFQELLESLDPMLHELIESRPVRYADLPRHMPQRGIYLFSEGAQNLYVGRTNRLRERLRGHCAPGSTHVTAAFAFRIARLETGKTKASYRREGSRADLVNDADFGPAFTRARERLRSMDIRYVEERDPIRQNLLEVYVAVVLKTPFNDFENH